MDEPGRIEEKNLDATNLCFLARLKSVAIFLSELFERKDTVVDTKPQK